MGLGGTMNFSIIDDQNNSNIENLQNEFTL